MVDASSLRAGDYVRVVSDLDSVRHCHFPVGKKEFQGTEFRVSRVITGNLDPSMNYRISLQGERIYLWLPEELENVYQDTDVSINVSDMDALLGAM